MIWNTPRQDLLTVARNFERAPHTLQTTTLIAAEQAKLGYGDETVRFFEIPPISHHIGKLVVPFVAIDGRGFLNNVYPAIYGVTKRANALPDKDVTRKRAQEAQVFAEHMSLSRGIMTPYARASSEHLASQLIPDVYVEEYANDRIVHLQALVGEVHETELLTPRQRKLVMGELDLGVDALKTRISGI